MNAPVIVRRALFVSVRDEEGRRIGSCPDGTEFTIEKLVNGQFRLSILDSSRPGSYGYTCHYCQDADTREELLHALAGALGFQGYAFEVAAA